MIAQLALQSFQVIHAFTRDILCSLRDIVALKIICLTNTTQTRPLVLVAPPPQLVPQDHDVPGSISDSFFGCDSAVKRNLELNESLTTDGGKLEASDER